MTTLSAGPPIEPPRHPVGRRTTLVADPQRNGRLLGVDVWYPAASDDGSRSRYELFPGVSFRAAVAQHEAPPATGIFPLLLFSHGRTGMRFAYSMLCEALAARGAVVVSADHPGDALTDWLVGSHVDDETNEINRVGDAHALLAELRPGGSVLPAELIASIDHDRVAMVGHSYGAYTAFATAAGTRGVPAHDRVRAVAGLQPFTRTMSDGALGRVVVPALLVISELDVTTPASTDADRPWALLRGRPTWRADVSGATHHAASDMGLYAEMAQQIAFLPSPVRQYLEASSAGVDARPWRDVLAIQIRVLWSFLEAALDIETAVNSTSARMLSEEPGLTLQIR